MATSGVVSRALGLAVVFASSNHMNQVQATIPQYTPVKVRHSFLGKSCLHQLDECFNAAHRLNDHVEPFINTFDEFKRYLSMYMQLGEEEGWRVPNDVARIEYREYVKPWAVKYYTPILQKHFNNNGKRNQEKEGFMSFQVFMQAVIGDSVVTDKQAASLYGDYVEQKLSEYRENLQEEAAARRRRNREAKLNRRSPSLVSRQRRQYSRTPDGTKRRRAAADSTLARRQHSRTPDGTQLQRTREAEQKLHASVSAPNLQSLHANRAPLLAPKPQLPRTSMYRVVSSDSLSDALKPSTSPIPTPPLGDRSNTPLSSWNSQKNSMHR